MLCLEITEVVLLVHCNILVHLLDISSKNFILLKTFNSEFLYIEVWFTDQNSKPLEIEGHFVYYFSETLL